MLNKIQPFFKSFLLLASVDLLFFLFVLYFFEARLLIPACAGVLVLNSFFYLSSHRNLLKKLDCQKIHPEGGGEVQTILKEFKQVPSFVDYYLSNQPFFFSLCYGNRRKSYVVFSELLWDCLSQEERKMLLCYHLHFIREGWTLFLTLLHSLFYGLEKVCFLFYWPQTFFGKRKKKKSNVLLGFLLRAVGFFLRKSFLQQDQKIAVDSNQKQSLALLLWKIQSLYPLRGNPFPPSFTPLLIGNPLTSAKEGCYIPFQPQIRVRVKALRGSYPP